MLTQKEKSPLYDGYFTLIDDKCHYAKIRSNNTGDAWLIRQCHDLVETLHKPRKARKYHHQCNSATVASAVKKIKEHDKYKLRFWYGRWR